MRFERSILAVAAVLVVALTVRLGLWQLDRAAQKAALQASLDERRALPSLPEASLARDAAAAALQYHRRTELHGHWRSDATVYLENRQMDGRPGFFVVTPLQLSDGTGVLVQRGWLPRDPQDRTRVQAPPLPDGEVRVQGRIAPPPQRLYEVGPEASGPIRQNLETVAYAQEIKLLLRPLSLLQELDPGAGGDALQRRWLVPAADLHKHYGYAAQWFALAALTAVLYVWFQVLRPRWRAKAHP